MAVIKSYTKEDGTIAYKFNAYLGVDPMTGKKKRTTRQGFKTPKEAKLALSRLMIEIEEGGFKKSTNETFQEIYELWLDQYKNRVKESTLQKTIKLFDNHILQAFGELRIEKITVLYCQKQINEWCGKLVHFRLLKNYAAAIFDYAARLDLIKDNPINKVAMPIRKATVGEENEIKFYDKEELQRFFACCNKEAERTNNLKWVALFRLLAFSGMRKGEALALTWKDLDFMNETVSINKTLTRGLENRLIIQTPKTASSKRAITLDKITLSILNNWRKHQATDYLKLGFNTMNEKQLIFPNTKNELMAPTKVGQQLNSIIKKYDLNKLTVHGFRHTHCSLLFESGATIKEVQDRLGHSDVQTTMNIYAHVTQKAKEQTAEKFAKYVNF